MPPTQETEMNSGDEEQTDDSSEESAETELQTRLDSLEFHPDETVSVDLSSAIWALTAIGKPADVPVDEYIEETLFETLMNEFTQELTAIEVEVELDRKQWERARLEAVALMQGSKNNAETAFKEYMEMSFGPQIRPVVDGERMDPEDLTASVDMQLINDTGGDGD